MSKEIDFSELFTGTEENLGKLLQIFYQQANINMKTDLTLEQIQGIIQLEEDNKYINELLNIDMGLKTITDKMKELFISKTRLGRNEAMEVMKARFEEREKTGVVNRLLGRT